jgi:uncharacterized membrane protein
MGRRPWKSRIGAAIVTAAALVCAIVAYRTFRSDLDGGVFGAPYALAFAAGICAFVGLIAIAILLSSRCTPDAARDPLWTAFILCVAVMIPSLPVATGGSFTPWCWWSFFTALAFSVVVNSAWAIFLVIFIQDERRRQEARDGPATE